MLVVCCESSGVGERRGCWRDFALAARPQFPGSGQICLSRRLKAAHHAMTGLLPSSRRPPCGTWFASLGMGGRDQMIKNIRSIKCFGVFLQMRAFADIESRFAAARIVFHQRRTADAAATLAGVQGVVSLTEVARSMSRRQIREWQEPPGLGGHIDSRHRGVISLDPSLQPEVCGLATSVSCGIPQAPRRWSRKRSCKVAITPPGQMPESRHVEVVCAHGLFANLILRRVRAQGSSATALEQPNCFSNRRELDLASAVGAEVRAAFTLRSGQTVTRAAVADSPDPSIAPLETKLAELAWRHLRGRAVEEKP